jgi:hypothetical protein
MPRHASPTFPESAPPSRNPGIAGEALVGDSRMVPSSFTASRLGGGAAAAVSGLRSGGRGGFLPYLRFVMVFSPADLMPPEHRRQGAVDRWHRGRSAPHSRSVRKSGGAPPGRGAWIARAQGLIEQLGHSWIGDTTYCLAVDGLDQCLGGRLPVSDECHKPSGRTSRLITLAGPPVSRLLSNQRTTLPRAVGRDAVPVPVHHSRGERLVRFLKRGGRSCAM